MNGLTVIRNYSCFLLLSILVANTPLRAQSSLLIVIQTENNQLFEVKWNGKNYASSASGYLVVPQVGSGNQSLLISFGGELPSEYAFNIVMANESRGFSLRQAIDNSWSVFDLVDLGLTKGSFIEPVVKIITPVRLWETMPATVIPDKPLEKIPVKLVETPVVKTTAPATARPREPMVTAISKIFDKAGNSGIDQVYILTNGSRSDTIALFIPVLTEEIPKTGTNPAALRLGGKSTHLPATARVFAVVRQRNPSFTK